MTIGTEDWADVKRRLMQRWPGLQEEDIEASGGDRTALVALLQGRFGYARPNAEQDLDEILDGKTIVPTDIASERSHTGTSEPIGEPAELPTQPPKDTGSYRTVSPTEERAQGSAFEGAGGRGKPRSDHDRWAESARDRKQPGNGDASSASRTLMVIGILVGLTGAALLVRMLITWRRRKQTRVERVSEQARHLLDEISERMPSVEEFRDRVRALEELGETNMRRGKNVAASVRRVSSRPAA